MSTASDFCFRLLGLPAEIADDVVLYLPDPAVLRLRVMKGSIVKLPCHRGSDAGFHFTSYAVPVR
jgi:hypothetical protein